MKTKVCTKCKQEKLVSEFGTSKAVKKDGYNSWCQQCCRDSGKRYRKTSIGIYNLIKNRQKWLHKHHDSRAKPFLVTQDEFVEWYDSQPKTCGYCQLSEEHLDIIAEKYGSRWKRLTVDCKDNDLGYIVGNLALACDKCNITKNNMLTYEEMLFVGKNFINPKWGSLLEK